VSSLRFLGVIAMLKAIPVRYRLPNLARTNVARPAPLEVVPHGTGVSTGSIIADGANPSASPRRHRDTDQCGSSRACGNSTFGRGKRGGQRRGMAVLTGARARYRESTSGASLYSSRLSTSRAACFADERCVPSEYEARILSKSWIGRDVIHVSSSSPVMIQPLDVWLLGHRRVLVASS